MRARDYFVFPHDNRSEFPRINENKRARVTWLRHFAHKPPPAVREVYLNIKQALGVEGMNAIKRKVVKLNTVKEWRPPLSPEFRAELVETFREEVALLSRLLNRDLSHWV